MRKLVLLLGILAMAGFLAGGFMLDCVTLTRQSQSLVETADGELRKLEDRLIAALDRWSAAPEEVRSAAAEYKMSSVREDRHRSYDSLSAAVDRGLIASREAGTPPPAEVADNIAGAMNRRSVSKQQFQEVEEADRAWRGTLRGRWGDWALGEAK